LVVFIATPSFGTATGAFRLGQFLGPRKPDLLVTDGNQLSMPDITMDNIIFLGPATGNPAGAGAARGSADRTRAGRSPQFESQAWRARVSLGSAAARRDEPGRES
jgi:hypothetical protein